MDQFGKVVTQVNSSDSDSCMLCFIFFFFPSNIRRMWFPHSKHLPYPPFSTPISCNIDLQQYCTFPQCGQITLYLFLVSTVLISPFLLNSHFPIIPLPLSMRLRLLLLREKRFCQTLKTVYFVYQIYLMSRQCRIHM